MNWLFLRKNPLKDALIKQLSTIKCFQKKTKDWFENFSKTANFFAFLMKEENSKIIILAKKFVKRTRCLQPSKCLQPADNGQKFLCR